MSYLLLSILETVCVVYARSILWAIRNWRYRRQLVSTLLIAYFGSYALLSLDGQYVLANHGGADWSLTWCPDLLIVTTEFIRPHISPTPLAFAFLPLLLLDRYVVHPPLEPWDGYYESRDAAMNEY